MMPAYNAEATLLKTHGEVLEQDYVDLVIVVDDTSKDETVNLAGGYPGPRFLCMSQTSATAAIKKPATDRRSSLVTKERLLTFLLSRQVRKNCIVLAEDFFLF